MDNHLPLCGLSIQLVALGSNTSTLYFEAGMK